MKALWTAGPWRGQVAEVRTSFVQVDSQAPTPAAVWGSPDDEVQGDRLTFHVMAYAVGDRAWRVLAPLDQPHPDVTVVQALIDAEPATLALVEVGV